MGKAKEFTAGTFGSIVVESVSPDTGRAFVGIHYFDVRADDDELTPAQARRLARWLNEMADDCDHIEARAKARRRKP